MRGILYAFLMLAYAGIAYAGDIQLAWEAPAFTGPPQDVLTYRLHYGVQSGQYDQQRDIAGDKLMVTVTDLPEGIRHYFALSAVYAMGESGLSNEASGMVPLPPPGNVRVIRETAKLVEGAERVIITWRHE